MSKIEWTDETWNVVTGCTRISDGCTHCYIERTPPFRMAHRRFDGPDVGATTGVQLHPERFDAPLRWRKPRRVFVNSMSDLFHDDIPAEFIAKAFGVMAARPNHTYQILTKRPARMRNLLSDDGFQSAVIDAWDVLREEHPDLAAERTGWGWWPLPHIWLGVSVESQKWADIRIPQLLDTPAAVRWISAEPLLGPVDLSAHLWENYRQDRGGVVDDLRLNWVVVGGETGPGARPMHPDWARTMRDQCTGAGVPFFFKQWGDHVTVDQMPEDTFRGWDSEHGTSQYGRDMQWRVGKKAAGRLLDEREWNEYPAGVSAWP